MIRMLIVFAIRSERALFRDVQVNFAYRWFCGLSIEDKIPDHSAFSRARKGNCIVVGVQPLANTAAIDGRAFAEQLLARVDVDGTVGCYIVTKKW